MFYDHLFVVFRLKNNEEREKHIFEVRKLMENGQMKMGPPFLILSAAEQEYGARRGKTKQEVCKRRTVQWSPLKPGT